MSKRVLILTAMRDGRQFAGSKPETDLLSGCERLNNIQQQVRFYTTAINELIIRVQDDQVTISDTRNDCDLASYDFVQLRCTRLARDHFQAVAFYLQARGVAYDDPKDASGTTYGKISQMVQFALAGVPVPDTIAVWNTDAYRQLLRDIQPLPFILKDNHGNKGARNYLIREWRTADHVLATGGQSGFIVQPFIPNDGDYRVLQLGGQRLIMHRQAQGESHLNNTSQGGQGNIIAETDCPPAVLHTALHALEVYGHTIGGADVLLHKETGAPYVLEVNDTPAIMAGSFKDEKGRAFIAYATEQLTKESEK